MSKATQNEKNVLEIRTVMLCLMLWYRNRTYYRASTVLFTENFVACKIKIDKMHAENKIPKNQK